MALILAIEPDSRQAAQLAGIVRHRLNAELLLGDTTEQALDAIGDRIPDLVLIPALLSPQDDAALAAALRVIAAAANVRTLTIPVFAASAPREASRSMLSRWRRARATAAPDGCDPSVFADQIATYLAEAVAERAALQPEPAFEEPVIESAHIETDYVVVEPAAAIEAMPVVAYEPLIVPVDEPPAVVSAIVSDAVFLEADAITEDVQRDFEPVAFESADVIEIDLSDETLEPSDILDPLAEDESVFELSLDDGADALVGMQAAAAPVAAIEPAAPIALEAAIAPVSAVAPPSPVDVAAPEIFENEDLLPAAPVSDLELWMPLTCGSARLWPAMEGAASEYVDLSVEIDSAPAPPKAEHPEWTELIASLRQDMERRRDAVEPPPTPRVVPRRKAKPVQDEWGFFDPEQCGFAALLAKLDEITDVSDEPVSRRA
jgi:hypothetical protein